MDLGLAGKTAIVTGASRGIGLAITRELTTEGVRVVGAARTITAELQDTGAIGVAVDLTTADGCAELVRRAVAEVGGVDVLVNNAGGGDVPELGADHGFAAIDDDRWRQTFDLNYLAAVRVTRATLPSLTERRGNVINVSSIGARLPHTGPVDYTTAKAALSALGKALAEELGGSGIRVNTVSPGPTLTALWQDPDGFGAQVARASGVTLEQLLAAMPAQAGLTTGRLIAPDEIAGLVAFLASDRAASITGADYRVDAGAIKTV